MTMKNEKAAGYCSGKIRLKNKKGMVYTITTFLVFLGILAYVSASAGYQNSFQDTDSASMSSQRVFHYWMSVDKNVGNIMNISQGKSGSVFEVNDTLPAQGDINSLLGQYGNFADQYFKDGTIDMHFEDSSGNKIDLSTVSPQITLSPMNITYGWDIWGKNELQIMSPVSSLGYIQAINLTISIVNESIADSTNSIIWNPYKSCKNGKPCLLLYLYVADGAKTIASAQTTFDLTGGSKADQINFTCTNCWLRVRTGAWSGGDPQNVLKIELQNLNITTDTKIAMNTSSFYANFPAKLFVGTGFASKLDYMN